MVDTPSPINRSTRFRASAKRDCSVAALVAVTVETMPPSCTGNLFITGPFKPHLELPGPVAAKDNVGVTVDQGRSDEAAFKVDGFAFGEVRGQIRTVAYPGDLVVVNGKASLVDQSISIAGLHGRQPGTGQQPGIGCGHSR